MKLVIGHDAAVAKWAEAQGIRVFPPFVAFGVIDRAGSLYGAWIFQEFYPKGNIEITVVGQRCWYPKILQACFRYAFVTCECSRITARTRRGNALVRRLLPRMGFQFESTQKRFYGATKADDGLVFVMFRESAEKWLNEKPEAPSGT